MFIRRKKYNEDLARAAKEKEDELQKELDDLWEENERISLELEELKSDFKQLQTAIASVPKKTVSEATTNPEAALSGAEVVDQWLNGKEGDEG